MRFLVYIAAAIEIFGGVAIQWPRTARDGAFALGSIYLIFALLWVPRIVAEPLVFDPWGNFFEQFSLVAGALIVYAWSRGGSERPATAARLGYIFFGICVVSFTMEQLVYLSGTAAFVPKWIPPGQMFLGDSDHDCVGARGHRSTFRTFGPSSVSLALQRCSSASACWYGCLRLSPIHIK